MTNSFMLLWYEWWLKPYII